MVFLATVECLEEVLRQSYVKSPWRDVAQEERSVQAYTKYNFSLFKM